MTPAASDVAASPRVPDEADVVVVGSGPAGCSAARAVAEYAPGTSVLVLEAGPEVSSLGSNLLNLDPAERNAAYERLARIPARSAAGGARPGTRLVDPAGGLPGAKYACNVGGMAAHWTCACPRPAAGERTLAVGSEALDAALRMAESYLGVSGDPFLPDPAVTEVRSVLTRAFPDLQHQVRALPMAAALQGSSGRVAWNGVDVILTRIPTRGVRVVARALARRLQVVGDEVAFVEVFDLEQRRATMVRADAVIVAADAFHTPQLLWASGIRPRALGRYLNVHHLATATVRLGRASGGCFSADDRDDIVGALWIPFDGARHPLHGQVLVLQSRGRDQAVHLAWYAPQEPDWDNRVRFDTGGTDAFGLPQPHIDFRESQDDQRRRAAALLHVRHAASGFGDCVAGGEPRLLPPGAAIHYQGTARMGARDDGTSVCDPDGRVWGMGNLYLAGNGVIDRATAVNPTLTSAALAILSGRAAAVTRRLGPQAAATKWRTRKARKTGPLLTAGTLTAVEYVALFPAGTANLVAEGLRNLLPGVKVLESDESALFFSTPARLDSADAVPIAKNLFIVRGRTARRTLDGTVTDLARRVRDLPRPRGCTGFRVMFHFDGQLVAPSPQARQRLEDAINSATGLRPQPRGNCQEYWAIGRRDWSSAYLGERLPGGKSREPAAKGSLSGQLSALLVSLSRPDPKDVFLDPFAGSGSIVAARLATPAQKVIYNDLDRTLQRSAAARLGPRAKVAFLHEDGTALASVKSAEVTAIVTDPPWGEYDESIGDYAKFADALASEFSRVLNPHRGRLVLLVSRRNEEQMQASLTEHGFSCEPPIGILVNGHPASVIRCYPHTP